MEIFNIGPLELLLILVIALIVLGPDEMIKTGRKMAKAIRKIVRSPIWKSLVDTSHEIKQLPKKLMDEAGLDETVEELNEMNEKLHKIAKTNPLDPQKLFKEEKIAVDKKPGLTEQAMNEENVEEKGIIHQDKLDSQQTDLEKKITETEKQRELLEKSQKSDIV